MAMPTIEELLARIERLEARSSAVVTSPAADEPADSHPRPAGMTRRGMVTAAAAGTAGIVGAVLLECGGAASAVTAGPASFTSSSGPAVKATNTGKGNAILATGQSGPVILANQNGTGLRDYAVSGVITNGSGAGTGVQGTASKGTGVAGSSFTGIGVHGSSSEGDGVVGSSVSRYGVYGLTMVEDYAGVLGSQQNATTDNWAIYGDGNIGASGTKSAVVPAADGGGHVTLYCVESPECWFEDFGAARLGGGTATVQIDPGFAQTVHTAEYHVFVQAEGECRGLSVRDKTATGFVVRELAGGTSNTPFAYRIVARRKDVTAPRLNRVTPPKVRAVR